MLPCCSASKNLEQVPQRVVAGLNKQQNTILCPLAPLRETAPHQSPTKHNHCCFAALLLCEQKPRASTPEGCCGLKQTTKHNPLPLSAFARNSAAPISQQNTITAALLPCCSASKNLEQVPQRAEGTYSRICPSP
ncbi:hypothetical protein CLV59_11224 [Chitinophaga dinghuensis]|uniref:Uncharacterized protein n=1 Tax=Chitinophaga dinghuensis TaxID=1539050 RepID=A0A327VSW4_9BACT|nr:hypothetical protein CLV59_11224 [Chitinophaga dinghuensis]